MNHIRCVEALWFEPGTAADAAAAINMHRARVKHVSPAWVKQRWQQAKREGRLPPFNRPVNGFAPGPREVLLQFRDLAMGGQAA